MTIQYIGDACVTHIIHIADVHVRVGDRALSRADEYRHVFNAFCDELCEMEAVKNGTALLVIAGDVFHNKGRMDSVAGQLFFEWINRLLDMLPIVVICGNHDFRQESPDFTDMIDLFTTPYSGSGQRRHSIHYLRDTGLYLYGNIGFGVTSVKDTLRACNTAGIVDELADFPSPVHLRAQPCVEATVALFHGTISQSALPTGRSMGAKGYPLAWFAGYDIVLLGDNHKQQIHTQTAELPPWGYPGSLIQQDMGEPTFGHGYLVWDIASRTAFAHHVQNPYGSVTVSNTSNDEHGYMVHFDAHTRVRVQDAGGEIPQYPRVRVMGTYQDQLAVQELLRAMNVIPTEMRLTAIRVDDTTTESNSPRAPVTTEQNRIVDLSSPARWEAFMQSQDAALDVHELIHNPASMLLTMGDVNLPPEIVQSVNSRNVKLRALLDAYDAEVQRTRSRYHDVVFKYIEWDYLMCYGANNWFDFELLDGKVALLNGPNATGKSAYMDVLCIALFGQPTSSRREFTGDAMSAKLIYDEKPDRESSYVQLRLAVDGTEYEIYRSFTYSSNARSRELVQTRIVSVFEIVGGEKYVVAEGVTTVDKWVQARVGTADEMLMSTMLCQSDTTNFFFCSPAEQRLVLERALRMDTITAFERVLDEAVRAHKYVLNEVVTYHKGLVDANAGGLVEEADSEDDGTLASLMATIDELRSKSRALIVQTGGMDADTHYDVTPETLKQLQRDYDEVSPKVDEIKIAMLQGTLAERKRRLSTFNTPNYDADRMSTVNGVDGVDDVQNRIRSVGLELDTLLQKRVERPQRGGEAEYDAWKADQPHVWVDDIRVAQKELNKFCIKRKACRVQIAKLQSSCLPAPVHVRLQKKPARVTNIAKEMLEMQRIDAEIERLQANPTSVARPVNDDRAVGDWNKRWREWNEMAGDVTANDVKRIERRIERIRASSEIAELLKVELNPRCPACRKQPQWLRIQALRGVLQENKEDDDAVSADDLDACMSKLAHAKASMASRAEYELRLPEMVSEHEAWTAATVAATAEAKRLASVSELQSRRAALHWRVWDAWNAQMKKAQDALIVAERDVHCVDAFIRESDEWASALLAWRDWRTWDDAHRAVLVKLEHLREHELIVADRKRAAAWASERDALDADERATQAQMDQMIKKAELKAALVQGRRALAQRELLSVNDELARCERRALDVRDTLVVQRIARETTTRQLALYRGVQAIVTDLQSRTERIRQLQQRFVGDKAAHQTGFKAYVYDECVLPLIQSEVNRFISTIEPFRLKIRMKHARFVFLLEDRGCTPTLDHASGYQKFVVGLGMRLALSRIQAAGHNVKHLFMDEGFVACDADNLQKTAGMLQEILAFGGYRSMIMMSHLDTIRDAAHVRIGLRRSSDNRSSILQWGQRRRAVPKKSRPTQGASAS